MPKAVFSDEQAFGPRRAQAASAAPLNGRPSHLRLARHFLFWRFARIDALRAVQTQGAGANEMRKAGAAVRTSEGCRPRY